MIRRRSIAFAALTLVAGMATAGDPMDPARKFAREMDGCGLDHGYVCVEPREEDFLGLEADRRMLPGNWLLAWQAAMVDFQAIADLEPEQREPRHYKFGFAESDAAYIVHFQPLLLPSVVDGEVGGIAREAIGRQVRYWIDKTDFSVAKRLYYK